MKIYFNFKFFYDHESCFEIKTSDSSTGLYNQGCAAYGFNSSYEITENESKNYIIVTHLSHGSYLSGYLEFENNCKIKIPTKNFKLY